MQGDSEEKIGLGERLAMVCQVMTGDYR